MNIQVECFDTKSTMNIGNYLSNTAMELVLVCFFVVLLYLVYVNWIELNSFKHPGVSG